MKKYVITGLILFLLPLGYLAIDFSYEFLSVDACLDSGGSYDYVKRKCDYQKNHNYIP